jgi:hypothetical protein
MYPEWISMDNGVLWGLIFIIVYLIGITGASAIFISTFQQNKKKAYMNLLGLLCTTILVLINVYTYSKMLVIIFTLMNLIMGIIVYYYIKNRKTKEISN